MKKTKIFSIVCLISAVIIIMLIVRVENSFENAMIKLNSDDEISILKIIDSERNPIVFYSQFSGDISYTKYVKSLFGYKEEITGVQGINEFVNKKGFSVIDIPMKNEKNGETVLFGIIDKEKIDYIELQLKQSKIIPNIYIGESNALWYQILDYNDYENLDSLIILSYKNGVKYSELDYNLEKSELKVN